MSGELFFVIVVMLGIYQLAFVRLLPLPAYTTLVFPPLVNISYHVRIAVYVSMYIVIDTFHSSRSEQRISKPEIIWAQCSQKENLNPNKRERRAH